MFSLTLSKRRLSGAHKGSVDLEQYRNVVEEGPFFVWMEDVNESYRQLQLDRETGKAEDGIAPRKRMDFFYIRTTLEDPYTFRGSFDEGLDVVNIQFHHKVDYETILILEQFANDLDVKLYDGLRLKDIEKLKEKYSKKKKA